MSYINKFLSSRILVYGAVTTTYGLVRQTYNMKSATTEFYDKDTNKYTKIPVLLTSKIMISTLGGCMSFYIWPYYLHNDLNRIEIYIRNEKPSKYGYDDKKHIFDYLFY